MANKKTISSNRLERYTDRILRNNEKIKESHKEVASAIDKVIEKYRERDVESESKASLASRVETSAMDVVRSWLPEYLKESKEDFLYNKFVDAIKKIAPDNIVSFFKGADGIKSFGEEIEKIEKITNAFLEIGKAVQKDYTIGTAIDGLSFHNLDQWNKFYDDIKAARSSDLTGLSENDRSKKEMDYLKFDALMENALRRYDELVDSRNKYDATRKVEFSNLDWFLNFIKGKISPLDGLVLHKKEEEKINFNYDNKKNYILGEDVNSFWAEKNVPIITAKRAKTTVRFNNKYNNGVSDVSLNTPNNNRKELPNIGTVNSQALIQEQVDEAQAVLNQHINSINTKLGAMFQEQQRMFTSDLEKKLADIDAYYEQRITREIGNESAISELKTKQKNAKEEASKTHLKNIDDSEKLEIERLQGMQSIGMTELVEEKKLEITKKYISLRIKAQRALAAAGDENAKIQVEILEASLKNAEARQPSLGLKALADKALFNTIQKGFEKVDQSTDNSTEKAENAKNKTIDLFNAITGNAGQVLDVVNSLKSVFGGMDESLDMVLESVGNIAQGFVTGGMTGGIIAVISEGFRLLGKAKDAEKRHQSALKVITSSRIAQQREYNLLLMEQNLLMKEATTIFGEEQISKAARYVQSYKEAFQKIDIEKKGEEPKFPSLPLIFKGGVKKYYKELEAYNQGIGGLYNQQIVTGHKKTGLFGWGKGKDTYSSIVDVYGYDELIDKEGKINVGRVQTIINTQQMSDETKSYLQNLIKLQDVAEKAEEALDSYLQSTFGSLGTDLMKSITNAIRDDGINAWEEFGKAGASVLEKLGEQLAYELFFADKFKDLQNDLKKVYSDTESITDAEERSKEIAKQQMSIVGNFYNNIGSEMETAQAFMTGWKESGQAQGFNMWDSAENSTRQGAAGSGITSMSENTASELNGSFYAIRQQVGDITNMSRESLLIQRTLQTQLTRVADNTEYCRYLENVKNSLEDIQTRGVRIKD